MVSGGGGNLAGNAGGTDTDASYATVGGGSGNTALQQFSSVAAGI